MLRAGEGEEADDRQRSAQMAAAQAGDRDAYAAVLRSSIPVIRATAARLGVPEHAIDDVVQDTLLTVHRARHTYDPTRPYLAWLRAIAKRRAIDAMRRAGRRRGREVEGQEIALEQPDTRPIPSSVAEQASNARRLREVVATLPRGQRDAVEQLVLAERSLPEAAAAGRSSAGAMKVNLHRALKSLRARLVDRTGGGPDGW